MGKGSSCMDHWISLLVFVSTAEVVIIKDHNLGLSEDSMD